MIFFCPFGVALSITDPFSRLQGEHLLCLSPMLAMSQIQLGLIVAQFVQTCSHIEGIDAFI